MPNIAENVIEAVKKNPLVIVGIGGVAVLAYFATHGKGQATGTDNAPITYQILGSSGGGGTGSAGSSGSGPIPKSAGYIGPPRPGGGITDSCSGPLANFDPRCVGNQYAGSK